MYHLPKTSQYLQDLCCRLLVLIYSAFAFVLYYVIYVPIIMHAYCTKRNNTVKLRERLGIYSPSSKNGTQVSNFVVWFHAASVGEVNSIRPFLAIFSEHYPNATFLITTRTNTSAALCETLRMKKVTHVYAPIDTPQAVGAFLSHWAPNIAIFVESEIWPLLLVKTNNMPNKCSMVLLNARFSDNKWKRWRLCMPALRYFLSIFNLIVASSKKDMQRITSIDRELFTPKTHFFGNIKIFGQLDYDKKEYSAYAKLWSNRVIFVCSSTHAGEEEILIATHKKLRRSIPNLLTIMVPRHPERADAVAKIISLSRLSYITYSTFHLDISEEAKLASGRHVVRMHNSKQNAENVEVFLVDAIGKLGTFYRLANVVFVGGSMVEFGGQNILEPLSVEKRVVIGENYNNFTEIVEAAREAGVVCIAHNQAELESMVHNAIESSARFKDPSYDQHTVAIRSFLDTIRGHNFQKLYGVLDEILKNNIQLTQNSTSAMSQDSKTIVTH